MHIMMENNWSKSNSDNMSEDVRELCSALLKAEANFEATGLKGSNPHFKSKYARLEDVRDAVVPALREHGIKLHQGMMNPNTEGGLDLLETRLIHAATGQWMRDIRSAKSEKPGMQGAGSACSYARRYAILTICGIAPSEDDDGESERKYIEDKEVKTINPKQILELFQLMNQYSNASKMGQVLGPLSAIQVDKFEQIKSWVIRNGEKQ